VPVLWQEFASHALILRGEHGPLPPAQPDLCFRDLEVAGANLDELCHVADPTERYAHRAVRNPPVNDRTKAEDSGTSTFVRRSSLGAGGLTDTLRHRAR
jgi:hypothetical protein